MSFRRLCGFASYEPTPERTAFVRVRRELIARSLDRALFEAATSQLEARGVVAKTGTLVDSTLIASASIKTDEEARWAGHRRKKPVLGPEPWHRAKRDAGSQDAFPSAEISRLNAASQPKMCLPRTGLITRRFRVRTVDCPEAGHLQASGRLKGASGPSPRPART